MKTRKKKRSHKRAFLSSPSQNEALTATSSREENEKGRGFGQFIISIMNLVLRRPIWGSLPSHPVYMVTQLDSKLV